MVRAPSDAGRASAIELIQSLPPDAILKVIDVIGDVVRTRASMAEKHAGFLREMATLREKDGARERVMRMVADLLLNAEVNDEAKMRLVDTICQIALR